MKDCNFSELIGKTLSKIEGKVGDDVMLFFTTDGDVYRMFHFKDCCESVTVEDICGDLADLIGTPIVIAEETKSKENPVGVKPEYQDSFTWTFYHIRTIKGTVTVRWYGSSNGYYSESVDFVKEDEDDRSTR